ncbi:MAG: WD40 repeat domain-containing protein [Bacteroidota bacterium]
MKTSEHRSLLAEDILPLLILSWQSAGYTFGVDQHIRLRRLLKAQASDDLDALKYLLAPVFADTPQKQQEFYDLFDEAKAKASHSLHLHQQNVDALNAVSPWQRVLKVGQSTLQQWVRQPKAQLYLWLLLLVVSLGGFSYWGYVNYHKWTAQKQIPYTQRLFIGMQAGMKTGFCMESKQAERGEPISISLISAEPKRINIEASIKGASICFNSLAKQIGYEPLRYQVCYSNNYCHQLDLVFLVDQKKANRTEPTIVYKGDMVLSKSPVAAVEKDSLEATANLSNLPPALSQTNTGLDTMILSSNPSQAIEGVTKSLSIGKGYSYFSWEKAILLGALASLLLLIGWWIRRRRQKFSLEHRPPDGQPHAWTIRIPALLGIDLGNIFQKNLRQMLQRESAVSPRLDVSRTVRNSVKKGGAVAFEYLELKTSRQYLFLFDTLPANDHQAHLVNYFIKRLQQAGAPIEYFHLDKDTLSCWNQSRSRHIPLYQLAHSYQNHQLIFCSKGEALVDLGKEGLTDLADTFDAWRDKVLLTPNSHSHWGATEGSLLRHFQILPCTPGGLSSLVEALESKEELDYVKFGWAELDKPYQPIELPKDLNRHNVVDFLKTQFVENRANNANDLLLRWIAACAIPPQLFWHWTLLVGELLSDKRYNRLNLENLFTIVRLPWFVEGEMPEAIRLGLIDWLEEKYPAWMAELRKEWHKVLNLEENLPPPNTMAWKGHRLEIILNELLQNPGWAKRRRLELELERLIYGQKENDAMVIKYLENKYQPLDAKLTERFRPFVQEKESLFWRFRMWVWQVPVFGLLFLSSLLIHYTVPVTIFPFEQRVTAMAFAKDGQSFYVANGNGGLAVCSVSGEWLQGLEEKKSPIIEIANSLDGNMILGASDDNTVFRWDVSGVPLFMHQGAKSLVKAMAFHPFDPSLVLIGFFNKRAELWDLRQQKPLLELPHKGPVNAVAFSPDGMQYLTGSTDGTAVLWNSEGEMMRQLEAHDAKIHAVAFSPDGLLIATGARDNTAKIWEVETGRVLHTLRGHDYDVFDVAFSADGRQLVTAGGDDQAIIWSVDTAEKLRILGGHRNYTTHATLSPDGKYLLTGDREGTVKMWHLKAD